MKREMSAMRVLLDTNVVIDLFTKRPPDGSLSQKFLIMREFGDVELWVSEKSFTDVFYVLHKGFSSERIHAAFQESFQWFNLCSVEGNDIRAVTQQKWEDFEDCLINYCAEKVKADYLITQDASGFARAHIPVASPEEFFELVESTYGLVYETIELDGSDENASEG